MSKSMFPGKQEVVPSVALAAIRHSSVCVSVRVVADVILYTAPQGK